MKSTVTNIVDYREIPIPEEKFAIEIPSWEAVTKPLTDQAKRQYEEMINEPVPALTDEMVMALNLPDVDSISELKRQGMEIFQRNQIERHYFSVVLPFILHFYAENTNVILNSEERERYVSEYVEQVQAYADEYNLPLEEYAHVHLHLEGDVREALEQQAEEDLIFKLIAIKLFEEKGIALDREAYDAFIQKNVVQNGADEIDLRARLSFEQFKLMMPEMSLSQEIYDFFLPKIMFKINPDVTLKF